MRNLRIALLLVYLLSLSVVHALKFQFVSTHQETSGDVAAQGTTLFLATLTGLDFTLWEADILSTTEIQTRFDVIADIPQKKEAAIRVKVFDYVSTGNLNKDFTEQGFPGVKVRLLSDKRPPPVPSPPKPASAPVKAPEQNKKENHTPDKPKAQPPANGQNGNNNNNNANNNNAQSNKVNYNNANNNNNNNNKNTNNNNANVNNNNGNSGNKNQGQGNSGEGGDSEPSSDPIEPTSEPIPEKKPPVPKTPPASPANAPPSSELAERNLDLPEGYVLSYILPIMVESLVYGFPPDLRDAVKWLLSEVTGTYVENWVLWDVIETSNGKYNTMFKYIGTQGTTAEVVEKAKTYVQDGTLERLLVEIDTAGEFKVYMGKIIAPANGNRNGHNNNNSNINDNNNENGNADINNNGESLGPTEADTPGVAGEDTAIEATPAAELVEIELGENQEVYPLRISVVSPKKGWNENLDAEIISFAASRSNTKPADWVLISATESTTEPGTFTVEYSVRIDTDARAEVDEAVVTIIRNRELDEHMDGVGLSEVEVRLLARVFSDDEDADGEKKGGAFRSSAGTIIGSVVGVVVVIAIGIIVAVCCLPKRRAQNQNTQET